MSIDKALVNMLVTDIQPAKIVEDKGFRKFINVLDPRYNPPSRRTIMRESATAVQDNEERSS